MWGEQATGQRLLIQSQVTGVQSKIRCTETRCFGGGRKALIVSTWTLKRSSLRTTVSVKGVFFRFQVSLWKCSCTIMTRFEVFGLPIRVKLWKVSSYLPEWSADTSNELSAAKLIREFSQVRGLGRGALAQQMVRQMIKFCAQVVCSSLFETAMFPNVAKGTEDYLQT